MQAKGQLENVKRACCIANQVMKFAVNSDVIESNCLTYIKDNFAKSKVTHMPKVPPNELGEVMAIMSNNQMKPVTRCATFKANIVDGDIYYVEFTKCFSTIF